jgi:CheY-like chemotaxis protein
LLADDEIALRFLISETLEDEGYTLVEVEDGEEAVEQLKHKTFDLIILDYMMPGLTGIEVCEWIRRDGGSNADKPVLLLTAKTSTKDRERADEVGVTQYIMKPFSPTLLVEIVKQYLPKID